MKKLWYIFFLSVPMAITNCSKDQPLIAVCDLIDLRFTMSITETECGVPIGVIRVTPTRGAAPFRFKLNDYPFQTSADFTGLKAGIYLVTMEDKNGCSVSAAAHIRSGISFKASVKPIIESKCALSGCHDGKGNRDFRVFSNLYPPDVKALTQSRDMPRGGAPLNQDEIDKIACWVDDGALNN